MNESDIDQLIDQRDEAEEWADKLAFVIAETFKLSIGEHSNVNNPWRNAYEYLNDYIPFTINVKDKKL